MANNYRSKFEKSAAKQLKKRRVKFEYESEKLDYILRKKYTPDFIIKTKTGKKIYLETKGRLRNNDIAKMKAVKEAHPDKDIRFSFMNPKLKVRKGAKLTHAEWAEKNGFPWCDETIPERWLKE